MRIAFILKDLKYGQVPALLTKALNSRQYKHDEEIMTFYEEKSFVVNKPQFALFPVYYTRHMTNGYMIATELEQVEYLNTIPTNVSKYYYVQDLDWLRPWGRDFERTYALYNSVNLICRSESHREAIRNFCGQEAIVVPNFDIDLLIKQLESDTFNSR